MRARRGAASCLPLGCGTLRMICSRISRTPRPVLPLAEMASEQSRPTTVLDLRLRPLDVGARKIDLVEDGEDLQALLDGQIHVGERLRLDPLRRVDDQKWPPRTPPGARDLVVEVHVAGVSMRLSSYVLPSACREREPHGLRLDGDARSRSMSILSRNCARISRDVSAPVISRNPVGQGRFPVVDVGDDREVADARTAASAFSSYFPPAHARSRRPGRAEGIRRRPSTRAGRARGDRIAAERGRSLADVDRHGTLVRS